MMDFRLWFSNRDKLIIDHPVKVAFSSFSLSKQKDFLIYLITPKSYP